MNTLVALIQVLFLAMQFLIWLLLIQAILSWLVVFNVISPRSPAVRQILWGLERLSAPFVAPIRRLLPPMSGIDIAPLVLIFALIATKDFLLPALLRDMGLPF